MKLTIDTIIADIVAADDAIKHFEETKIKQHKNIAAYHLQQATEKLIKVQIYKHSTQKEIFTHNIDKLITYAETLNVTVLQNLFSCCNYISQLGGAKKCI